MNVKETLDSRKLECAQCESSDHLSELDFINNEGELDQDYFCSLCLEDIVYRQTFPEVDKE